MHGPTTEDRQDEALAVGARMGKELRNPCDLLRTAPFGGRTASIPVPFERPRSGRLFSSRDPPSWVRNRQLVGGWW